MKHTRGSVDPSEDKQEQCNVCLYYFKSVRVHKCHSKCGGTNLCSQSFGREGTFPSEDGQEGDSDMFDACQDNGIGYFEGGDDIPLEDEAELGMEVEAGGSAGNHEFETGLGRKDASSLIEMFNAEAAEVSGLLERLFAGRNVDGVDFNDASDDEAPFDFKEINVAAENLTEKEKIIFKIQGHLDNKELDDLLKLPEGGQCRWKNRQELEDWLTSVVPTYSQPQTKTDLLVINKVTYTLCHVENIADVLQYLAEKGALCAGPSILRNAKGERLYGLAELGDRARKRFVSFCFLFCLGAIYIYGTNICLALFFTLYLLPPSTGRISKDPWLGREQPSSLLRFVFGQD